MRGVSLEEISAATRISTRFLQALEKENWGQLPGGVFNRGFIRSVAKFLGLDGDDLVSEYELERKEPAETPAVPVKVGEMPRNWRPAAAALAIVAALVGGGWFAYQRYALEVSHRIHSHGTSAVVSGPDDPAKTDMTVNSETGDPATGDPVAGTLQRTAATGAPNQAVAMPLDSPLQLKVQAGKPVYAKISADGRIVFDGHFNADQSQSFSARDSFEVSASESSALYMELNGQTLPPLGTPGQPGHVTLTREDLTSPDGGSH